MQKYEVIKIGQAFWPTAEDHTKAAIGWLTHKAVAI